MKQTRRPHAGFLFGGAPAYGGEARDFRTPRFDLDSVYDRRGAGLGDMAFMPDLPESLP